MFIVWTVRRHHCKNTNSLLFNIALQNFRTLFGQKFCRIDKLVGIRFAVEAEPKGSHDLSGRIVTTLAFQAVGKEFRLLQHERTVEQIERLKWRR